MDAVPSKLCVTTHAQYDAPDTLTPAAVAPSPLAQFRTWFSEAQTVVAEPEAMALSTTTSSSPPMPSVRFLLLKQVDERGFVFFTNYTSRKSRELDESGTAAIAFYWREMHRQVRAVGTVERIEKAESEAYFRSRPIGSRLGAWASPQSAVVGEDEVKRRLQDVEERFGVSSVSAVDSPVDVPLPEFWGGWRLMPCEVEFWSGKPSRLHDRVRYLRSGEGEWKIERLAP